MNKEAAEAAGTAPELEPKNIKLIREFIKDIPSKLVVVESEAFATILQSLSNLKNMDTRIFRSPDIKAINIAIEHLEYIVSFFLEVEKNIKE